MRTTMFLVAASLALASALAAAQAGAQDPKLVAKGQGLVAKNKCSMCHAVSGKGGKIGKALDGVADRYDAVALKRIMTDPLTEFPDAKIKMPKVAWAAGDVDAVVAYLQTLKGSAAK